MKIAKTQIRFKCGSLYSSGLRDVLNMFPLDERFIMDFFDSPYSSSVSELPGLTPLSNLFILYVIARQYNEEGKNILEIGTNRGKSSYVMATAAPLANLTSIEIEESMWLVAKRIHETGKVSEFITVPTVKTNLLLADSAEYLASYEGPNFDMIFIDGDHNEGVLIDAGWWNHLNIGGCILFHDYHGLFPAVIEVIEELKRLTGREPEVQLLTDCCIAGFYKQKGDKKWKVPFMSQSMKVVPEKPLDPPDS